MHHASHPRPLVIAHRGASGYLPEHSESAIRLGFAQGADAVEPDLVASSDGVLVIRHENELSGTTDIADRPEFADRRTTRVVDGVEHTGWFTEDLTWAEISTLRCRERIPVIRPESALHDDEETVLSLPDLLRIIDEESARLDRPLGMVAEIKHATHFAGLGLPLDELFARDLKAHGWDADASRLTVESFERDALLRVRERGIAARLVYLLAGSGAAVDEIARNGHRAVTFDEHLTDGGLASLAGEVDGISVALERICAPEGLTGDAGAGVTGDADEDAPLSDLVGRAHRAGLTVFTWTLRPENAFLPYPLRSGGAASDHGHFSAHWTRFIEAGVDGIFADHPDLAVRLVEERLPAAGAAAVISPASPTSATSAAGSADAIADVDAGAPGGASDA